MLCKITRMSGATPEESRIVKLPKSERELNALLQDMGIGRDNDFAYAVSDIKSGHFALDQQMNTLFKADIDGLNHTAGALQKYNDDGLERICIITEAAKPQNSIEFINVMHNQDGYDMYADVENFKELGEEVAFRVEGIDPESPVGMHVDYEAFGQDYHDSFGGVFLNGQYVVPPPELNQVYDGITLPGTDRLDRNSQVSLYLVSREEYNQFCIDSTEPRGIWVQMPTTHYALDRTAHRLGESSADDCVIFHANASIPVFMDEPCIDPSESPYEINTLAEVLSSFKNPAQMEKFEAVLEYEAGAITEYGDIINIACNLDCYNYDPEIETADDYLAKFYDNDLVKIARAEVYEADQLMLECGGKITANGFVARNDLPMEQIYEHPEPQQDQGMQMT